MPRSSPVPAVDTAICDIERRTAPRYPILQRCFVRYTRAGVPVVRKSIAYNISAAGIAITLPSRLPEGTELTIEAWGLEQACTLQARIVRVKQVELSWFTGCEFIQQLSDAELQTWRSGPLDWVDDPTR